MGVFIIDQASDPSPFGPYRRRSDQGVVVLDIVRPATAVCLDGGTYVPGHPRMQPFADITVPAWDHARFIGFTAVGVVYKGLFEVNRGRVLG
jgi:hypothetical protein